MRAASDCESHFTLVCDLTNCALFIPINACSRLFRSGESQCDLHFTRHWSCEPWGSDPPPHRQMGCPPSLIWILQHTSGPSHQLQGQNPHASPVGCRPPHYQGRAAIWLTACLDHPLLPCWIRPQGCGSPTEISLSSLSGAIVHACRGHEVLLTVSGDVADCASHSASSQYRSHQ